MRRFERFGVVGLVGVLTLVGACSTGAPEGDADRAPVAVSSPTSGSPSASASSASRSGSPSPKDAAEPELAFTGPPRVPYVDRRTLRYPDGRRVRLAVDRSVTSIVVDRTAFLATDDRWFEGTLGMHRLASGGRLLDSWPATGAAARSAGGRVAWISTFPPESGKIGPSTLLHVGDRTQELDPLGNPSNLRWRSGRVLYSTWGSGGPLWWSSDLVTEPRQIRAPAARVPTSVDRLHSVVVDVRRGRLVLRRADGTVLAEVKDRGLFQTWLPQVVWEGADGLLTTLARNGRQTIVRIDRAGELTRAGPWRPEGPDGPAFLVD